MSIFRQATAPGDYPIPDINLDPKFQDEFHKAHEKSLQQRYKPGDIIPNQGSKSYILQNSGDIDSLKHHHGPHMSYVQDELPTDLRVYDRNITRQHDLGTYDKIHHYFNGGIRLYMSGDDLTLYGYQVPTKKQLDGLDQFVKHRRPRSFEIELKLRKPLDANNPDPDDEYFSGGSNWFSIDTASWEEARNYIKSLMSNNYGPSKEVLDRINKLKQFRTPDWAEPKNVKPVIPQKIYEGTPMTYQQIEQMSRQYAPPILQKQYRERGAEVLNNLLHYAEILEAKKEYIKADMITNFVKQAISAEEIDWSQPNAYMTYMDAMKQKEEAPAEEQIRAKSKDPIVQRLQNGFYNDLLITDLAKLAQSVGFEVTANGQHFKFTDTTGKLRTSPNQKYKSGTILIGGHKKNNQGVADYQGAKDFAAALKYLGYI